MIGTPSLGIVTGLHSEAKLVRKAWRRAGGRAPALSVSGPNHRHAESAAAELATAGARVLVSFGLCGGLDPTLRPGDVLVAGSVRLEADSEIATDAGLSARLRTAFADAGLVVGDGALLTAEAPVAAAAEKTRLFAATGARAVDLESHGLARAAAEAGLLLAVVRAVGDPATRNVPKAALKAVGADGRLRLGHMIATMYVRPWESPAMLRLAYEARLGFDSLERAAAALAELFGGD